jgi:hypothetical protein
MPYDHTNHKETEEIVAANPGSQSFGDAVGGEREDEEIDGQKPDKRDEEREEKLCGVANELQEVLLEDGEEKIDIVAKPLVVSFHHVPTG